MNVRAGSGWLRPPARTCAAVVLRRDPLGAEPGCLEQRNAFRARGEQRLGADVDGDAADLFDAQLAADARRRLEHDDVEAGLGGRPGGGQPEMPPPTTTSRLTRRPAR